MLASCSYEPAFALVFKPEEHDAFDHPVCYDYASAKANIPNTDVIEHVWLVKIPSLTHYFTVRHPDKTHSVYVYDRWYCFKYELKFNVVAWHYEDKGY